MQKDGHNNIPLSALHDIVDLVLALSTKNTVNESYETILHIHIAAKLKNIPWESITVINTPCYRESRGSFSSLLQVGTHSFLK